jgi:DGQHR domain-containing protein
MKKNNTLEVPAIAIRQGGKRELFAFAIDGKQLHDFTQISRLGRGDDERIAGYQRPEVLSHIAEIRNYLESEAPMLPNSIVVAFDSRVKFRRLQGMRFEVKPCHGHLIIPLGKDSSAKKPGWIVDGQQRVAAIRDARLGAFPVFVTGFITDSVAEQREQFILVNSTKPLPKGLIYELLPETDVELGSHLQRKRFPAYLLDRLNYDSRSPLHLAIQTPTNPFIDFSVRNRRGFHTKDPSRAQVTSETAKAVDSEKDQSKIAISNGREFQKVQGFIKDNSVLRMLENSLHDGALYRCRLQADGEMDVERILELLFNFWSAVATVFKDAWYKPPKQSRLTHGVGVVSMGHLMDAISDRYRSTGIPTVDEFAKDLEALKPLCRWTDGYWDFGGMERRKWDEVQNTSKDVKLVANYLLVQYKRLVWSA